MGIVYRARQVGLGRVVALKLVRDPYWATPADLRRFQIEAESVAGLDHPNIVPIYDVGRADDQPYFSMKLIEGGNLERDLVRLKGDPRHGARLMVKVVRAVAYAHQRDDPPSRPQAVEHPARPARRAVRHRFRPGQAPGARRAGLDDPDGGRHGDPGLHAPRAGPRRHQDADHDRRRLQPGGDPLRDPDRPAAVHGRLGRRDPPARARRGAGPAAVAQPRGRPGPRDDLPALPGEGPVSALSLGRGPGRRPRGLARRPARLRPPGEPRSKD